MYIEKLQNKQNEIIKVFDNIGQKIFKKSDILEILSTNKDEWKLSSTISSNKLINFLISINKLKLYQLNFPQRKEIRYGWGKVSDYEIFNSLRPDSYFTHSSALYLHKLISTKPNIIYINYEQPQKRNQDSQLMQERIDFAFNNACRVSNMKAKFQKKEVCLLNGKFTGHNGVIDYKVKDGRIIRVTNIERTLIDSTVRPIYSGGVETVQLAYKKAVHRVNIKKLIELLSDIGFIYPYHQAIGFYIERSGVYSEEQIKLLEQFEVKYNFFLCHKITNKKYSARWKLFYPSCLD